MQLTVTQNHHESRLDRFLHESLSIPNSLIFKLIRQEKIKINNHKAKLANAKVFLNDVIKIYHEITPITTEKKSYDPHHAQTFKKWITFENDNIIIINKPHGIASQCGTNIKNAVDTISLSYNPECKITHRLDKETSGLMIIAKNKHTARTVTQMFKEGEIQKTYHALCSYNPTIPREGKITSNLYKDVKFQRMQMCEGDDCTTFYKILQNNESDCIIEVKPLTGKMHQIRVHLASLNMPIIGDEKYNGNPYTRMMLHASKIILNNQTFECPHPFKLPVK